MHQFLAPALLLLIFLTVYVNAYPAIFYSGINEILQFMFFILFANSIFSLFALYRFFRSSKFLALIQLVRLFSYGGQVLASSMLLYYYSTGKAVFLRFAAGVFLFIFAILLCCQYVVTNTEIRRCLHNSPLESVLKFLLFLIFTVVISLYMFGAINIASAPPATKMFHLILFISLSISAFVLIFRNYNSENLRKVLEFLNRTPVYDEASVVYDEASVPAMAVQPNRRNIYPYNSSRLLSALDSQPDKQSPLNQCNICLDEKFLWFPGTSSEDQMGLDGNRACKVCWKKYFEEAPEKNCDLYNVPLTSAHRFLPVMAKITP